MNYWFAWLGTTAIICSISVPSNTLTLNRDRSSSQTASDSRLAQATLPEFELQDFDFWTDQCRSLAELKDYEKAVKACERAIVLKPKQDNLDLWIARSDALFQLKQYAEALVSYNRVLSITPNSSLALTQKCAALYQLGQYEIAIDTCESALRINGDWGRVTPALAWYNRGLALQRIGRATEALDSYNRAQQIDPDNLLVQAERCRVLPLLRQDATIEQNCGLSDAVTAYEGALANNPNDAIAWVNQGLALEQSGEVARALISYENAVRINPKSSVALAHQCAMLNQAKQYQEALAACEQALQGDGIWSEDSPTDVWAQQSRALIGLAQYEESIAAAERAIALNPDNAQAWNNKAVGLWRLGKYANATQAVERAIQIDQRFTEAWFNKGRILSSLPFPDHQQVVLAYCQALNTNQYSCPADQQSDQQSDLVQIPTSAQPIIESDMLTNLSATLCQLGRYEEAAEAAQRATDLNPESFAAWYNQGLALVGLGDISQVLDAYKQAEFAYEQASSISPNNVHVLTGLGRALAGQRNTQAAIAAFETVLNINPNFTPAQEGLNQLLQSKKDVDTR